MTKKHYIAIANAVKETTETHKQTQVINKDRFIFRLTQIFKNDNINFNYTRFENACKSQGELI
tara:strand:- start:1291 stop:1479 length:189 start_codon:yes stop_codon:yes gene_type:complete